jgi:beta-lactamase regulating signal transducer with metallopeptidase domain
VDTLLRVGLSNAAVATALAVLVLAFGRLCRRPAVLHGLWLLVLLKLVTPPLVTVSFTLPAAPTPSVTAAVLSDEALAGSPSVESAPPSDDFADVADAAELVVAGDPPPETVPQPETSVSPEPIPDVVPSVWSAWALDWRAAVTLLWLGGSAVWFCLAAVRIGRFHAAVRQARAAPAWLQEQTAELARSLGLSRPPDVYLVPGAVAPMLWAVGLRPRLLVSAALWARLDEDQRVTLLLHELAHLRRGDHWVRGLELLATGLFWWHPVVWLARRELREAEEQCCDAWVVWALPGAARAYATALVEAVDYLSEARPALPPVASGFGHVHLLKRRLTMILRGTTPRALTWGGLLAVLGLGAVLLPFLPNIAQAEPQSAPRAPRPPADVQDDDPRPAQEERRRNEERRREEEQQQRNQEVQDVNRRAEEFERARRDLDRMRQDLERMRAQMQQAEARFREAQERLEQARNQQQQESFRRRDAQAPERRGFTGKMPDRPTEPRREPPSPDNVRGRDPRPVSEQRLSEVERKLDAVLRELEQLRGELRRGRPGLPPAETGPRPPRGPATSRTERGAPEAPSATIPPTPARTRSVPPPPVPEAPLPAVPPTPATTPALPATPATPARPSGTPVTP